MNQQTSVSPEVVLLFNVIVNPVALGLTNNTNLLVVVSIVLFVATIILLEVTLE
jgi:hypothetical protein